MGDSESTLNVITCTGSALSSLNIEDERLELPKELDNCVRKIEQPNQMITSSNCCFNKLRNPIALSTSAFEKLPESVKGLLVTITGILALTPDALLIRLSAGTKDATVLFYRYGLATVVLMIVFRLMKGDVWYQKFKDIGRIGFFAGLVWGGNNFLFTYAIQNTAVATALVILASNPMFSAIFSLILLKERIPLRTIVMCIISFIVITLIFVGELKADPDTYSGIVAAVFCSITLGLYFVLLRVASKYEG